MGYRKDKLETVTTNLDAMLAENINFVDPYTMFMKVIMTRNLIFFDFYFTGFFK